MREKCRKVKEEGKEVSGLVIGKEKDIWDEVDVGIEEKVRNERKGVEEIKNGIKIKKESVSSGLNEVVDEWIELIKNKEYKKGLKMVSGMSKGFKEREEVERLYEEWVERLDEVEFKWSKYKSVVKECWDIGWDLGDIEEEIKEVKNEKVKVMCSK